MRFTAGLIVSITALAGTLLASQDTAAQGRRAYSGGADYVVAESQWGHGSIRGAIRPGRNGMQVQLPGGSWIDCGRNCAQTLRQQTVDFWESNGTQAKGGGPGYFRWSFGW